MAHPHLFSIGKFGYRVKREVPLTPSKYFNTFIVQLLPTFCFRPRLHFFFCTFCNAKIQSNDQISIAMRKITSNSLNVGMLSNNFKATVH